MKLHTSILLCAVSFGLLATINAGIHSPLRRKLSGELKKQDITFNVAYDFNEQPVISPMGMRFFNGEGFRETGDRWPYVGEVFDAPNGESVGFVNELCTRTNDFQFYSCKGTYEDLFQYSGNLSFMGMYDSRSRTGKYTILGGTGDFIHEIGYILDEVDDRTGFSMRTIVLVYEDEY